MPDLRMAVKPPVSPYRVDLPLDAIIPPDRRRAKALALVAVGMIAGGFLLRVGDDVVAMVKELRPSTTVWVAAPVSTASGPGHVGPVRLSGPNGVTVNFPHWHPLVVNVWLQGCQDCMPAFEAYREIAHGTGFVFATVNVAYGDVDIAWARRYGVDTNLVVDPDGAAIVKPLGIDSFTTLVIDADGNVVHTDRPDRAGYAQRVVDALKRL